jgi:hypothetical protein
MKWAEDFKAIMGSRVLAKKLRNCHRKVQACNLDDARYIGVIYNATEYVSFEIIKDLVKQLSDRTAKVSVLGYVDSKKLIDHYLYRKGFDFFSKSDLNWYYKPVSLTAVQFIGEQFDLLLNLSLEDHFPIHYITTLSPALFKAGRYTPDDESLDFMIDIEKEKQTMKSLHLEIIHEADSMSANREIEADMEKKTETELQLKFLINQLMHYLSIINR